MNTLLKRTPVEVPLLALAVLAALLALRAPWLEFPLSSPLAGLDRHAMDAVLWRRLPALPFALCFGVGLLAAWQRWHRLTAVSLGLAFAGLLAVPLAAWLVDPVWFERYLREASDLQRLLVFTNNFVDTPNISFNVLAIRDAEDYRYLSNRWSTISGMLAWGWMVALLAWLACLILLRRLGRLPGLAGLVLAAGLGLLVVLLAGRGALLGDYYYRQADQRMVQGDYRAALNAYTKAIEQDPVLARSPTLMLSLTRASFQLYGPTSPFGRMYLAVARAGNLSTLNSSLLDAVIAAPPQGPLGRPLKQMALRLQAQLWVKRGVQAFRRNEFSAAELAFRRAHVMQPEWQHVSFFLARTLLALRAYDDSRQELVALAASISNPAILANIYNSIGDVEAAAGRPQPARSAYQQAYSLDSKGNLWAVKGLGGT